MPNDNIMGIPTRACINGFTKEDTERLKNALVKQILDDETIVNVTEDGKIIVANDDGLFLSFDDSVIGLTKDDDDNVIPVADPYIPMDDDDNPLAPANNVLMTSGNIAVDPRIVHRTGNEIIAGEKTFTSALKTYRTQNNNQIYLQSRGLYNRIFSRNFNADNITYDEHFQIGTVHATSTLETFLIRAFAPRINKGDTSENQSYITLSMSIGNDDKCTISLIMHKTDGTEVTKTLGSFDGTSWT